MPNPNQALLEKIVQLNTAVLDAIAEVTPAELKLSSVDEDWPLGLVVSHINRGYSNVAGWIERIIKGQPIAVTGADIQEANTEAKDHYTELTLDELVTSLKANMATVSRLVQSLNEEQLAKTAPMALVGGKEVNPSFVIDAVLVGHTTGHLESIKLTLASVRDEITT